MEPKLVIPPQELADEHTLLAQKYAGYFVGHPYRNEPWQSVTKVNRKRKWKEPSVVADDCEFCVTLNNEQAVRRIAGYQFQLDIECTRTKYMYLEAWLKAGIDVPNSDAGRRDWANLRRFIELRQDVKTEKRPNGWRLRPLPLHELPLRLKRKLCIEWNHVYIRWMKKENLLYDKGQRMFYREVSLEDVEGC